MTDNEVDEACLKLDAFGDKYDIFEDVVHEWNGRNCPKCGSMSEHWKCIEADGIHCDGGADWNRYQCLKCRTIMQETWGL
jgi:hypothetical protein